MGQELLLNVRRLARIALDRLEQGILDESIDNSQIRMIGGLAVRTLRLWNEAMGKQGVQEEGLYPAQEELAERLANDQDRGVTA